ncbi:MAG: UDP-glucose/GDP-mannose dehydrogenase family protein [Clostridia bacterium]|nr:UDP-glucose/GDP-mannose dehydrogenase family protein [Clostridia bacterium]
MKIGVIGIGYVGLVTGVCLADFGLSVICMDIDEDKVSSLREGVIPIYEPGLAEMVKRNIFYNRVGFTSDIKEVVEKSNVIFIAVGTPSNEDGSANLGFVKDVAKDIGKYINEYKVIVNKSTVPVGTGKIVKELIIEGVRGRGLDTNFDVVSNPEFLREGKAIYDFIHPDRVVIGSGSEKAAEIMKRVYKGLFLNQPHFVFTNIETAEIIKYASNAFLAVKISYINEMALLAEKVGANIQDIAKAMGLDRRIGAKFLRAGPGYGGSCLPKDTKAIVNAAEEQGEDLFIIKAAINANEKQKSRMLDKIRKHIGVLKGKTIGVLGITFKPDTDDIREAPSIDIIRGLVESGSKVQVFCPRGTKEAKWRLKEIENTITYCSNEYETAEGADALVLVTEWNQFRGMNLGRLRDKMNGDYFFDLRNIYVKDSNVRNLFRYYGVGI